MIKKVVKKIITFLLKVIKKMIKKKVIKKIITFLLKVIKKMIKTDRYKNQ